MRKGNYLCISRNREVDVFHYKPRIQASHVKSSGIRRSISKREIPLIREAIVFPLSRSNWIMLFPRVI